MLVHYTLSLRTSREDGLDLSLYLSFFFFSFSPSAFLGSLYHSPVDRPTPFGKLFSSKAISLLSCASSHGVQQRAEKQSPSQSPRTLYRWRTVARLEICRGKASARITEDQKFSTYLECPSEGADGGQARVERAIARACWPSTRRIRAIMSRKILEPSLVLPVNDARTPSRQAA